MACSSSSSSALSDDELVDLSLLGSLRCGICLNVFWEPVFCAGTPCQHTFCKSCLSQALEKRKNCPMCNVKLDLALMKPNLLARNLLDDLRVRVRCRHHALGCAWEGLLHDRATHETSCLAVTKLRLSAEVDKLRGDVQYLHEENERCRNENVGLTLENIKTRGDIGTIMKELKQLKEQSMDILCAGSSEKTYSFGVTLDEKISDFNESMFKKFNIECEPSEQSFLHPLLGTVLTGVKTYNSTKGFGWIVWLWMWIIKDVF